MNPTSVGTQSPPPPETDLCLKQRRRLVWAEISVFCFRGGMFQEVVAYTSLLYICWMGVATGNSEGMPPP